MFVEIAILYIAMNRLGFSKFFFQLKEEIMKREDLKLYFSIILWSLLPSLYFLIRTKLIAIHNVDINILGQMEWFDLMNEILQVSLLTPMFVFLKKGQSDAQSNFIVLKRIFAIYLVFQAVISLHISQITSYMQAEYATKYLLLQTVSMSFGFLSLLCINLFTLNDKNKAFYSLVLVKLLSLACFDFIFIPGFKEQGAAFSEITTNGLIAISSLFLLNHYKLIESGKKDKLNFTLKEWLKVGVYPSIQIFLDNFIYALIIMRMINAVQETGNFWMANEFIYGYLLLPVFALGEIIKKNKVENLTFDNFYKISLVILASWIIIYPFIPAFTSNVMSLNGDVVPIIYKSIPYYIAFILCTGYDSYFISTGKTKYVAFISIIVNLVYYPIVYSLFLKGMFILDLNFVLSMFGVGIVVHTLFSYVFYQIDQRKQ